MPYTTRPTQGTRAGWRLVPRSQIEARGAGGGAHFEATGNDPSFGVEPVRGYARVRPGWYRFEARVEVLQGFIFSPCLYVDYGAGMFESTRIDLPEPDAQGWIRAVIVLNAPIRDLRFDPTVHPAQFRLDRVSIRRLSRPGAVLCMLREIAADMPSGARTAARYGWALLQGATRGGVRAAARTLASTYAARHRRTDRNYEHWLRLFEAPPQAVTASPGAPVLSILLPVCDPPPALLRACLDSVRAQTDGRWQLCIADDASRDPEVRQLLAAYAATDPRIRVTFAGARAHISVNTNRALALADAPYIGFLDHDDELAADAVEAVAAAIERFPDAGLLYSDEDKIDVDGHRHAPHFKPAWNPDLLRSLNYVAHFMVVDAALLRELGGLREGFEGAQDHDLALRCGERLPVERIVHIPRVLYHWRTHPGSTARGLSQKPYAVDAGRRAVEDHLARTGRAVDVHVLDDGRYRVEWRITPPAPRVVVLVPTRDRVDLLSVCVDSVLRHTRYPNFEIVIVDNGSVEPDTEAYFDRVARDERVSVLRYPGAFNFSAIVNDGVRRSTGDVICLLNNDIEAIRAGWLFELVSQALRPEVGAVGAMLYYPDDTIQHAGVILGIGGVAGHSHCRLQRGVDGYVSRARVVQNLSAVTAACMAFRRDVFEQVGGFDERLQIAFNDVDFCMRLVDAGYLNVWTPHAELYHHESATRGLEDTPEKCARFAREVALMKRRWGAALELDPSYNPNLSLETHHFDLAFPPRRLLGRTAGLDRAAA